ncbi:phage holin family protein [Bartonella sp. HY761]|uniref:phage holin family protein n=1 Tax=Bartonella sp. HY761 TaxID=2979330 RepID=UPI0022006CB6|nr:phage holin family protein [Bartonella sp. HY761]UXN06046.1 phage holin family protein [Bartonella sp. HY761]
MFGLLTSLLGGLTSGGIKQAVKRTKTQVLILSLTSIFAVLALVFLCVFVYLGLTCFVAPLWAAGILFVLFAIIALLVFLIGQSIAKKQKIILEKQAEEERNALLFSSALAAIPAAIAGDKKVAMIGLPLIGLAALWLYKNKSGGKGNKPK